MTPALDEAVARVNATPPGQLYATADRFEAAQRAFAELGDRFRRTVRSVDVAWRRSGSPAIAGPARIVTLLDELAARDYATVLRRAGDALTDARHQVADLAARRGTDPAAHPAYDVQGRLILQSLTSALSEVGRELPVPPSVTATGRVITGGVELFAGVDRDGDLDAPPPTPPPTPAAPAGGGMPMMPMNPGMGMGTTGAIGQPRERRIAIPPPAEPGPFAEPADGWEIPGRGKVRF